MTDDTRDRVIRAEAQLQHLADMVTAQNKKLDTLIAAFEQSKGGWKVLLAAAGLVGFLAGKGGAILSWLGLLPK